MLTLVPHTKRRAMTKARAARIFLARDGICFNCRQRIRPGENWFIEHPVSLAQGGSDDDADLWPSHNRCKAAKDASDASAKAKRDRIVTQGWSEAKRPKMQGRQFPKRPPQHTATRPVRRKSEMEA